MASKKRYAEFRRWPAYEKLYIRAFDRMIDELKRIGIQTKQHWVTGQDVFRWWMEEGTLPGQVSFDDYEEENHG